MRKGAVGAMPIAYRRILGGQAMATVKIKAHAKINLTLEITGVENGFHMLDSLVASLDMHDIIVLKKRKDKLSSITMKGLGSEHIPPENNNALKAAEAFSKRFSTNGVDITVYKNIPLGGGLGGSSADVSGVLNGMAKLYKIEDEAVLEEIADELGSDTKYMLKGGFARMQGRGEKVDFLDIHEQLHFLMLCPKSSVNTKECYRKYDELPKTLEWKESQTEGCIRALRQKDIKGAGMYLTNDLYIPATHLNADVEQAYKECESFSPLGTFMTGSGSCVLALFETKELCEWAKSRYRGKCVAKVVKTIIPKKERKGLRSPWSLEE